MKIWKILMLVFIAIFIAGIYSYFHFIKLPENKLSTSIAVSKSPLSTPIYIADEMGFFEKAGIEVNLVEVIGGSRSFEKLIAGHTEYGTVSDSIIAFKAFSRNDFVNIATFVQSDNDVRIIVREDGSIQDANDLQDKNIAVIKSSASEYLLSLFLGVYNIPQDRVNIINKLPEEMGEALKNNEVDAIVVWQPYAYKAVQTLQGKAKALATHGLYSLTFNLITLKKYLIADQNKAERLLQALDMSVKYIAEHPVKTQQILKKRLELESPFINWIWGDYLFKLSLSNSLLLTLENEAEWILSRNLTNQKQIPDFSLYIDKTILQNAVSTLSENSQ